MTELIPSADGLGCLQAARNALLARHPVLRYEPAKADVHQLRVFNDIEKAIEAWIALTTRPKEAVSPC